MSFRERMPEARFCTVPPLVPVPLLSLFRFDDCLTVEKRMQDHTETLRVGSRAPDFTLAAANREGGFSLASLCAGGPLILEFLRGTW